MSDPSKKQSSKIKEEKFPKGNVRAFMLDKDLLAKTIDQNYELSNFINEKVLEKNKLNAKKVVEAEKRTEAAFLEFTPYKSTPDSEKLSLVAKDHESFTKLHKMVMKEDIDKAKKLFNKKGMIFRVSDTELIENGLKLPSDNGNPLEPVNGADFSAVKWIEYIDKKNNGAEFYARKSAKEYCEQKDGCLRELRQLLDSDDDTSPNNRPPDEDEANPDDPSNVELVERSIKRQLKLASAPEETLELKKIERANQETLDYSIQNLKLHHGPADETAVHDFYDLQIAFRPIWKEVFDQKLVEIGKKLYQNAVSANRHIFSSNIVFNNGNPEHIRKVTNLEDLKKYTDEFSKVIHNTNTNDYRLNLVAEYLPDLHAGKWLQISDFGQMELYTRASHLKKLGDSQMKHSLDLEEELKEMYKKAAANDPESFLLPHGAWNQDFDWDKWFADNPKALKNHFSRFQGDLVYRLVEMHSASEGTKEFLAERDEQVSKMRALVASELFEAEKIKIRRLNTPNGRPESFIKELEDRLREKTYF